MVHDEAELPEWKRWTAVLLLTAAIALLVLSLRLPGQAYAVDAADIQRVVVIHLDSTRMDDLGCYGGIGRTPNIDAIANRGLRYVNSITPQPSTAPSIASFLTARLPSRHGVLADGAGMTADVVTLPEVLQSEGFVTGGFVSNAVVDGAGFDRGFDEWVAMQQPKDVTTSDAERLVDGALDFVERHQDGRFFLWMLHRDPEAPYTPPAPYDTMYLDHPDLVARDVTLLPEQIHDRAYVPGRASAREYIARHIGEVSHTDEHVGRLLKRLNQLPGQTLLIITADHGESLGDVNYWFGHGDNLRHPSLDVPLIVTCRGVIPHGTRSSLAAGVDLAPTILDLLGVSDAPLQSNGRSLVATFDQADPWPERMVPLQTSDGSWRGVRSRDFCLQSRVDAKTGARIETLLYHLISDPLESRNVAPQYEDIVGSHLELEEAWFSGPPHPAGDPSGHDVR